MGLVIDLDVLLADLRPGEALLAEQPGQLEAAGDHVLGDHRVAGLHRERVAQPSRRPRRQLRGPGSSTDAKRYCVPGIGGEDHAQLRALRLGARLDHRIIIALASKQLGEQVGVSARAAADLRGIGRVLAIGLERGLLPERLQQIL